ncbi:Cgl0159 family (beta/alpha)8-fold protein [Paramaledivibacter caminithermalis]|uniref:Fructose-bisphosphate aldolase class Ia, DhnA family n=1 Tax=Paramaledivibacter caminithermalis (strain DSM 15212 / CIP 107654 / DViRD3) TaxID=1121301 RepID=A0A1M6SPF8_PARC5|nr:4Fe-4S binding protein [Paramaledivibacter caminithermalis]SHK46593.1 Fructose-bisphosphate aldolase class Ia, DhnA family [Paramaledivibacter caminithermalis DSM 15212]
MNTYRKRKFKELFNKEKRICVAMDHGFMSDPTENVRNFQAILNKVIKGGADSILISPGQLMNNKETIRSSDIFVILRVDWMNALRLGKENTKNALPCSKLMHTSIMSIKEALEYDVDAVVAYYVVGYDEEIEEGTLLNCIEISKQCHELDVPFIMEPMIIKGQVNGAMDAKILADAARISQEIGADALKIPYTGDKETFKSLVDGITIPILILGGANSGNDNDAYSLISDAIEIGASGILFGRKITKSKSPDILLKNIKAAIKKGSEKKINEELEKSKKLKFDKLKCTGCKMCENICDFLSTGSLKINKSRNSISLNYCDKCRKCEDECPIDAIKISKKIDLDHSTCILCSACIDVCPNNVLKTIGEKILYCNYCSGEELRCAEICPTGALTVEEF